METGTLSEFFTLIAPGASVAIAAVAAVLSVAYFLLAKRLFNETVKAMDEIEKSVNQMYSAMIRLSKKSESPANEIEGRVLQFEGVAGHFGQDAEDLNNGSWQSINLDRDAEVFNNGDSQPINLDRDAEVFNNGDSQPMHIGQDAEVLNNNDSQSMNFGQDAEDIPNGDSQPVHFGQDAEDSTNGDSQSMNLGRDTEVLNNSDFHATEEPPFRPSIDAKSIYEKVSGNEVLHLKPSQINGDSLQARISAIGASEEEEEEDEKIAG